MITSQRQFEKQFDLHFNLHLNLHFIDQYDKQENIMFKNPIRQRIKNANLKYLK